MGRKMYPWEVPGLIRNEDGEVLAELASQVKVWQCIVEIGPFVGKSTAYIASGSSKRKPKIHSVDPWDLLSTPISGSGTAIVSTRAKAYEMFLHHLKKCQIMTRVRVYKAFSAAVAQEWSTKNEIGMLYIDGNHKYPGVKLDIESWLPKLHEEGIAVFDDYDSSNGVKVAVNEWLQNNEDWLMSRHGDRFVVLRRNV